MRNLRCARTGFYSTQQVQVSRLLPFFVSGPDFDKSLITTLKAIVDVIKTNRFVLLFNVYSFWSNQTLTLKYLEKRHNYTRSTAGRRQESV